MIPGSNLLNAALSVITRQPIQYLAYSGRTVAANGDYVPTWAAPVNITGQVQPVQRRLYSQMGLDFQKNYFYTYVPSNIFDIARNTAGDQFIFNGITLAIESNQPWFGMDGWTQSLCVQVS